MRRCNDGGPDPGSLAGDWSACRCGLSGCLRCGFLGHCGSCSSGRRQRRRHQIVPVAAPRHILAPRLLKSGTATAGLPPATHCLVERDQALGDAAASRYQALLLVEQRALRVQHPLEVHQAFPVLDRGDGQRAFRGLHGLLEEVDLRPALGKHDRSVVHFARGPEHGVLVNLVELPEAGILDEHLVGQPAVIEHVPGERGPDTPLERGRRRPDGRLCQSDSPDQRDRRVQRRLADADQRRLRGELHFRGPDVRPPAQQVGRHVGDDTEFRRGDLLAAARHLRQRTGRPAQQHVQGILRLAQGALQLRDRRDGAEVKRLRLLHVQLGFVAALRKAFR